MTTKEKEVPRYLQDKDGHVRLYAAADIAAARQQGLIDPVGNKSNGEPWNPPTEEGEQSIAEATATVAAANAERQAKIQARKDKEAEAARKAAGEPEVPAPRPDFTVAVIDNPDDKAAKSKKK